MLGPMQPAPDSQFFWGTAGWVDDGGAHLDLADRSNDGSNLVRVTLFSGRTPTTAPDETQAQGAPLLCRICDHVAMPQKGDLVMVAVPHPFGKVPGSAVIIGRCSNNAKAQANLGAGEQVLQIPGSPAQIMIRQNGSIVFKTSDPKGNDSIITFAPNLLSIVTSAFVIKMDTSGIRFYTHSGAELAIGGLSGVPAPLDAIQTIIRLSAGIIKNDAAQVWLGADRNGTATYMPVPYSHDPSPAPLYSATMIALAALSAALLAAFQSMADASGVTAPQRAAVTAACTALDTALGFDVPQTQLSTGVKISAP